MGKLTATDKINIQHDRSNLERDMDRGWSWVIMFASFSTNALAAMVMYGAGMIHVALLQRFEMDVAFTSLIGSVFNSLTSISAPIASMLITAGSCRTSHIVGGACCFIGFSSSFFIETLDGLLWTYGILGGSGICFCLTPSFVILSYYFDKYRGIATGFAASGAGAGMLVSGPVINFFFDQYGINGTFLILGGLSAHFLVIGALMKPSKAEILNKRMKRIDEAKKNSQQKMCNIGNIFQFHILKSKTFVCILIANFLWFTSFAAILLHLPYFSVEKGFSNGDAAILLTFTGLGSTVNRLLTGVAVGPNGIDPLLLFMGSLGIAGVLTIFFPFYAGVYYGQCLFALTFGMYSGCLMALQPLLAFHIAGIKFVSSAFGLLFLIGGIGFLLGPPLAGFNIDSGGTYEDNFYVSGGSFLLGSIFSLVSVLWIEENQLIKEERTGDTTVDFEDFKRSQALMEQTRFLGGSGLLTGSMILTINVKDNNDHVTENQSEHTISHD